MCEGDEAVAGVGAEDDVVAGYGGRHCGCCDAVLLLLGVWCLVMGRQNDTYRAKSSLTSCRVAVKVFWNGVMVEVVNSGGDTW